MSESELRHGLYGKPTSGSAFAAVTDVRGLWSGRIEGTDKLGAEFAHWYEDVPSVTGASFQNSSASAPVGTHGLVYQRQLTKPACER